MSVILQGRTLQQLVVDAAITGVTLSALLHVTGPVGSISPPVGVSQIVVTGLVVGVASTLGTVVDDYLVKQGLLSPGM